MEPRTTPRPRRPAQVGCALGLALGLAALSAIATWGLVGPQRESVDGLDPGTVMTEDDYDYAFRAPDVDPGLERVAGGAAALLAAAVATWVVLGVGDPAQNRGRQVLAVATAVAAGVVVGGGGRIVTAGVIGANIGGGLVLLVGPPTAAVLLGCSLLSAWPRRRDRLAAARVRSMG